MDELTGTWVNDPSHYPEPLTPLSADVWLEAMGRGMHAATRELRAPFGGFQTMVDGAGWAYEQELEPDWESDPPYFEARALEIGERWEGTYRPRVVEITREILALGPERPGPEGAAALFDRLLELVCEQWRIHFLVVVAVHAARELLHDAYVARFGKTGELEPYRLLEGLPNETLVADELLWQVGERARALGLAGLLLELPAEEALHRLDESRPGREVLAVLAAYLDRYGGRSRLHELSEPREAERPEQALGRVRLLLERPRDFPGERRARAEARERLEVATLARIGDPADRAAFAELLTRVTAAVPLQESHAYYIDYPGLFAVRRVLLGFGSSLVSERRLERPEEVFFLRRDELAAALASREASSFGPLVAKRRGERLRAFAASPPRTLGVPPDPNAELPALVAKLYGVPGSARRQGDRLEGIAASPGLAVGPARIVRGADDFADVHSGDVLVCATTTPAWTPLFGSLAGLVTETGGILSHAAVVAREYALAAVVGAEGATRLVLDGDRLEVDGDAGAVTILREPRPADEAQGAGRVV